MANLTAQMCPVDRDPDPVLGRLADFLRECPTAVWKVCTDAVWSWLDFCAAQDVDPKEASQREVASWEQELSASGVDPAVADDYRRCIGRFYAYLERIGLVTRRRPPAGNPNWVPVPSARDAAAEAEAALLMMQGDSADSALRELEAMLAGPEWMADAACHERPDVNFFPVRGQNSLPAKRVCAGCLVRDECRSFALDSPELTGVWGGTTNERDDIRARFIESTDADADQRPAA